MTNETPEPKTASIAQAIASSKAAIEVSDEPKRKRGRPKKSENSESSFSSGNDSPSEPSPVPVAPQHSREAIGAVVGIVEVVAAKSTGYGGWVTEGEERNQLNEAIGKYLDLAMPGGDLSPGWAVVLTASAIYIPKYLKYADLREAAANPAPTPRKPLDLGIPEQIV